MFNESLLALNQSVSLSSSWFTNCVEMVHVIRCHIDSCVISKLYYFCDVQTIWYINDEKLRYKY